MFNCGTNWLGKLIMKKFIPLFDKYQAMRRIIATVLFAMVFTPLFSQEKSIPYTQADRDRLVRVETRIEGQDKRFDDMNNRIDDMNNRIGDMNNRIDDLTQVITLGFSKADARMDRMEDKFYGFLLWGFGIIFMSIMGLVGFIIYDRRKTLAPVEMKTELLIKALRTHAETNPDFREILKHTALW